MSERAAEEAEIDHGARACATRGSHVHGRVSALTCISALIALACHADSMSIASLRLGETNRSVTADVGQQIEITLRTVGPRGQYDSLPALSTDAVRFVDMSYVDPVPAGPTQRFRFVAVARGRAVIIFRHTDALLTVEDTVNVR